MTQEYKEGVTVIILGIPGYGKSYIGDAEIAIKVLQEELEEVRAQVSSLKKAKEKPLSYEGSAQLINGERVIKIAPTYNEQRKVIIAEAKAFVEGLTARMGSGNSEAEGNNTFRVFTTKPEFHVNAEKRTVVALVKGANTGRLFEKAIAKCEPDDVFNADIGKAIALGRALGLNVSKFEQAVKPTEVVDGMEVANTEDAFWGTGKVSRIEEPCDFREYWVANDGSYNYLDAAVVLEDTDAQY